MSTHSPVLVVKRNQLSSPVLGFLAATKAQVWSSTFNALGA